MKPILIATLVFLSGITVDSVAQNSAPETPLTFDEALQMMLLNSEVIKQSELRTEQLSEEKKALRNLRLPQISLNANYILLSDDVAIDLHEIKDAITPLYGALSNYGVFSGIPNPDPATNGAMPILPQEISTALVREQLTEGLEKIENASWNKVIQKRQFGTLSAGMQWPLYAGGKIEAANQAATIRVKESQFAKVRETGAMYTQLVERYFGLALASRAVEVRIEVLSAMEAHLNDARKLFEEGLIPRAELLHAQVYHAQADRELREARRQRSIVSEGLSNSLAVGQDKTFLPTTTLFYQKQVESVDFFKQSALNTNPILSQIQAKKELARQGSKAEFSGLLPVVAAFGNYNLANIDLSPNISDYMVGVTLSWKLFGGTSSRNRVKSARLVEAQVEEAHQKAARDIETGIEKYHQELMMALEQLEELESAWEFASEYQRVQKQAFHEGMATSTDVVDASLALAKVRIERLQAVYRYDVALAKLLELAGIPQQFPVYQMGAAMFEN